MQPSAACRAFIKSFESYARAMPDGRCQAYPDPGTGGAPWTIGFGSTGADVVRGLIWTRDQAEARFTRDVDLAAAGVARIAGACTQGQFDALVSFAYNAGLAALEESTLLRKHRDGQFAAAAAEFSKWVHSGGRVLAGLVRRRRAEAELYLHG